MFTTRYGQPEPADDRLLDREDPLVLVPRRRSGIAEREHLDLVELVHAEDAARVLAVGAGLAPEVRRDARVPARELVGGEDLAAVQRRERHLARADEEQLVVVDLVDLRAVGREEPGLLHRRSRTSTGRHDRREPLARRASASPTAPARARAAPPRASGTRSGSRSLRRPARSPPSPSPRRTRRGRAAGGAAGRRPRARTSPSSSPPSGTDASAGFGTCSASARSAPSAVGERLLRAVSSSFSAPAAAIFAGRSSGAAFPIAFDAAFCRVRSSSTVREQRRAARRRPRARRRSDRRDPLALDAGAVLRFVAQPLEVDHRLSPSRICARRSSSHVSRRATPGRRRCRRRRRLRRRRPDTSRGTSPRPASPRGCAGSRRRARRRGGPRSR